MPAGTKVDEIFQALKRKGKSVASAAKIAQSSTGRALMTGKPPKHKPNAMNRPNDEDGDEGYMVKRSGNAMRG
jgi:hypothetical protein